MRSENFIAFFTIFGFFIALVFSLLKSVDVVDFLLWSIGITIFFYLFIHLVFIFFYTIDPQIPEVFNKKEYESLVNYQINTLQEKEENINKILETIKQLKE